MDLRRYKLQTDAVGAVLNYQPFVLSDDIQTGVAYSWLAGRDPRVKSTFVFHRGNHSEEEWAKITDANARLRAMYEDFLDEIAARFPGGTLLDVACNNGYFPVGAELRGLRGFGMDLGDYSASIATLNHILGTTAQFIHAAYDSTTHVLPIKKQFDVVIASAILCHLPDPLYFLTALAGVASRAILFWGQMVNTDALLIAYNSPHPDLSQLAEFPHHFNDNTRISRGLFIHAMKSLGFTDVAPIMCRPTWLTELHQRLPQPLEAEIRFGSAHFAFLCSR